MNTAAVGSPVYLTKNGRGCFTIMDMEEQERQQEKARKYDKMEAQLKLMCELNTGRKSGEEKGWIRRFSGKGKADSIYIDRVMYGKRDYMMELFSENFTDNDRHIPAESSAKSGLSIP